MISLIVSFFIISPTLILYTTGYRYDWKNRTFLTTGVLSIEGDPRDMRVFINSVEIEKTVPIRLTNLTPNTYRIRLEKEGFIPWEKDITIESNKTTYIKHITLIQQHEPTSLPAAERFTSFALSYDGAYILGMRQSATHTFALSLLSEETKKETPLSLITASTTPHMEWSPYDDSALIVWKDTVGQHIRFISGERGRETETFTFEQTPIEKTQWDSAESSHLFLQQDENIFSLTSAENEFLVKLPLARAPWYIDTNKHLWTYDADKHAITRILDGNEQESITVEQPVGEFIHVNSARVIIRQDTTIHVIERTSPPRMHSIPAESVRFSPGTHEWIAWSPWELWTIYQDGNATLLNRTGDPIQFVHPLDEFGVLLIATQNSLTVFNPGYYVTQKILDVSDIREVRVQQKQRKIIFTRKVDDGQKLFEMKY